MTQCQMDAERCPMAIWCLANGRLYTNPFMLFLCATCHKLSILVEYDLSIEDRERGLRPRKFPISSKPLCLGPLIKPHQIYEGACCQCEKEIPHDPGPPGY